MSAPSARFTLRDLPLPAKLVVTCFLLTVGVGYFSALVQLHFQDSKSGEAMPTVKDVVLKFTGKKWVDGDAAQAIERPVSKLEKLVSGSTDERAVFNGTGSMAPAFFSKDPSPGTKNFRALIRTSPGKRREIEAQREGERQVVRVWINTPETGRRDAYDADLFLPPADQVPKAIDPEWRQGDGFRVRSIIETRCVACHGKNGSQEKFSLETYEKIESYMSIPTAIQVPPGGGWVKVEEPIGLEKLTQSTHAHLLSFAMLFSLTGLAFAFTSYPGIVRSIVGPLALVAIVVDVAFWWLARLSDSYGVYFAMSVLGTGGVAGAALFAQIALSVWNMYGQKGKIALLFLLALGGAIGTLVYLNVIQPGLEMKKSEREKSEGDSRKKMNINATPAVPESRFDRLLRFPKSSDGKELAVTELKFKKDAEGGMVRAFFDRDETKEFKEVMKQGDENAKKAIVANRRGELAAFRAWFAAKEADRKAAYDADRFEIPAELAGKPITDEFKAGDRGVKVKSLIENRCVWCHKEGGEKDDIPLDTYDGLLKHLSAAK